MDRAKQYAVDFVGPSVALGTVVATITWEARIETWLRILALLIGIASGIVSLWVGLRKLKKS